MNAEITSTAIALAAAVQPRPQDAAAPVSAGLPALPWRDPSLVPPEQLAGYIEMLEQACLDHPSSAGLRTCLGMAYAMNYDVYRSLDALECAVQLDNAHFFAQMKYSELLYRLRALHRAEEKTVKALNLAGNTWELSIARRQLHEIRRLKREGLIRPDWKGSLRAPALMFTVVCLLLLVLRMIR